MTATLKPLPGFVPRAVQSPSALKRYEECPRWWGHEALEGRRSEQPDFFALGPPPPKAPADASGVEKAKAKAATKAYNALMRPAQGTALHAIWEAYYLQKTPGAWHPPMAWRADLDELWHTRPGQIALSGREHLPNPRDLAEVWVEELVTLDLSFLPGGWPHTSEPVVDGQWVALAPLLVGGTPDLVTAKRVPHPEDFAISVREFRLWDYKSTVSIEIYAKTPEELVEDEQANIYGLAVMQRHGLYSLACTWLYFQTDDTKPPRSEPRHFFLTRLGAEAVVARLVERAHAMAAVQAAYLAERPGMLGRRLEVINSLATNDMACDNFSGCPFHAKRKGGFCKPRKSTFAEAERKLTAKNRKTKARKDTARAEATERKLTKGKIGITMALTAEQQARLAELEGMTNRNFKQNKERVDLLKKQAEESAPADEAADAPPSEPEAPPAEDKAPASEPAPAPAKAEEPKPAPASKPKAPKPAAEPSEGTFAVVNGHRFEVPTASALGKLLAKASKALQAAASAFEGES